MGQFAVILPAAGQSTRFGDPRQKKIYAELEGRAVWLRALDPFLTHGEVEQIIVAIAPEDREMFDRRYRDQAAFLNLDVIEGGTERADTVARALERVRPACQFVAIHDAARPCLTEEPGDGRLRRRPRARRCAAGRAGERHDQARRRRPTSPPRRFPAKDLYLAQTPQVFRRDWLEQAHAQRAPAGRRGDRRHAARRGPGTPLRHRRRLDLQPQDHDPGRPAARRCDPPHSGKGASHRFGHPFADETTMWDDLPGLKPTDLFDS